MWTPDRESNMSERDLRQRISELQESLDSGEGTARKAAELERCQAALRQIMKAKYPSMQMPSF